MEIRIPTIYCAGYLADVCKFVLKGYLAVTLLMHENSDLLRLVVNSIRKDLDENNEISNCLALHAIANVGSNEMAEALAEDVHRLLISP
jgi:AP-2 complex subunit alpha